MDHEATISSQDICVYRMYETMNNQYPYILRVSVGINMDD